MLQYFTKSFSGFTELQQSLNWIYPPQGETRWRYVNLVGPPPPAQVYSCTHRVHLIYLLNLCFGNRGMCPPAPLKRSRPTLRGITLFPKIIYNVVPSTPKVLASQ